MQKFLDIHTHRVVQKDDEVRIYNSMYGDAESFMKAEGYVSVGLHPWYLHEDTVQDALNEIAKLAKNPQIIAIGECGLDRTATNFDLQQTVFIEQIALAEQVQKPVIVHCVRAYETLIAIKKQHRVQVPMIVHGFGANPTITQQLLKHDFYLSLGSSLLNPTPQLLSVLPQIPLTKLFLETDTKDIPIQRIFVAYSELTGISVEELKDRIWENFLCVVGYCGNTRQHGNLTFKNPNC